MRRWAAEPKSSPQDPPCSMEAIQRFADNLENSLDGASSRFISRQSPNPLPRAGEELAWARPPIPDAEIGCRSSTREPPAEFRILKPASPGQSLDSDRRSSIVLMALCSSPGRSCSGREQAAPYSDPALLRPAILNSIKMRVAPHQSSGLTGLLSPKRNPVAFQA